MSSDGGAEGTPPRADHDVIAAAMQDQLDDLAAAVTAQQATIDGLLLRVRTLERRLGASPAT
jgi:uncharacterized coiled-coil protein SlyX